MKHKQMLYSSVVVIVLVLAAFLAGSVSASTGCFTDTNSHWAETFICWMKDSGITSGVGGGLYDPEGVVTRAQMAVFMQKQSQIPPSTGDIYINAGINDYVPSVGSTASGATVDIFADWNELRAPAAGSYTYLLTPDLPTTLYGKQLYLAGAKVCYKASATNYITSIGLYHYYQGTSNLYNSILDNTDRTEASNCVILTLPFAGSIYAGEHVVLIINSSLNSSNMVGVYSTAFILKPSDSGGNLQPGNLKEQLKDQSGVDTTEAPEEFHQAP